MFRSLSHVSGACRAAVLVLCLLAGAFAASLAAAQDNPSGLPLPRFAATRSSPINVRTGPGTRYDISWVYVKAGTPVEIVQEFDTWRKIRDVDGSEGWVHQNLLAGERAGLVTPWNTDGQGALRDRGDEDANILAWLGPNFPVTIDSCDGTWCAVKATDHPPGGNPSTYSGFVMQADLWGVYSGETFD
jgi:SH3-like domain-containing protein